MTALHTYTGSKTLNVAPVIASVTLAASSCKFRNRLGPMTPVEPVMVSTMASGNVGPWVDIKDITMMFSVTDILGLNPVMRTILANAAGAAVGMAQADVPMEPGDRPLVGVTTVGITTQGAMKAIEVLEAAGYEAIVFHAIGPGGRAE